MGFITKLIKVSPLKKKTSCIPVVLFYMCFQACTSVHFTFTQLPLELVSNDALHPTIFRNSAGEREEQDQDINLRFEAKSTQATSQTNSSCLLWPLRPVVRSKLLAASLDALKNNGMESILPEE